VTAAVAGDAAAAGDVVAVEWTMRATRRRPASWRIDSSAVDSVGFQAAVHWNWATTRMSADVRCC